MNVALFLEIKNEYTEHLVDTITPYIYEGLTSIYKSAVRLAEETNREGSVLIIFQKLLQQIDGWNQIRIIEETNRIKQMSNTSEYLDDLVKAVIKSNIILLAYSNSISNLVGQSFYNSLTTATFIHRCYTECGKDAHNNPYLFFYDRDFPMEYKRNQLIIHQHIEAGIAKAIRKILPISMILKEYLVNSINIINEPPKVELVGNSHGMAPSQPFVKMSENRGDILAPDQLIDPKLEKAVMSIIKSDSVKSDKQKIQAIMNMDKLISSMEPKQTAYPNSTKQSKTRSNKSPAGPNIDIDFGSDEIDMNPHMNQHSNQHLNQHLNRRNISAKKSEFQIDPFLMERNDMEDDPIRIDLNESERKLLNINFDKEPTVDHNGHSVPATSLSGLRAPNRFAIMTSERVDPSKIEFIEDYGSHRGGSRRKKK